jgi:lipoyl-dependent peroxiredoxin
MAVRTANAEWRGSLQGGDGTMKMQSGAFEGQYSFSSRFEEGTGTNPEELIAAAHAACLSMALSGVLEKGGTPPTRVTTTASATIEKAGEGFRITRMRLEVRGEVPGIDQAGFAKAAEAAKEGCPVSQALKGNVAFELDARLA